MYREMAEEEDNKMAERWQSDAKGILIFVSPHLLLLVSLHNQEIDWFILCRRCGVGCGVCPGPQARPPGYDRILSRKYLSDSRRTQRVSLIHPFHSG